MTKELGTGHFGDDWPRQKLLCYDVREHVITALGCTELLQESKLNPRDSKLLKIMFKRMKVAAEQVEELMQIICQKQREGTL
jgi:hypothetical protein